jgi:hypothetical protein
VAVAARGVEFVDLDVAVVDLVEVVVVVRADEGADRAAVDAEVVLAAELELDAAVEEEPDVAVRLVVVVDDFTAEA